MEAKTKEQELAEVRARHAAELAKVEREAEIRFALPVPPYHVHIIGGTRLVKPSTFVTYKAPVAVYPKPPEMTLAEAMELVEKLPPSVALMRQAGCLSVQPEALMEASYLAGKDRGESLVALVCESGRGFGPYWSLEWFTLHGEVGWVHVKAEIQAPRVRAYVSVRSWDHGEPVKVEKHADEIPGARLVSWGGGSRDAGRWSWHFLELDSVRALAARQA